VTADTDSPAPPTPPIADAVEHSLDPRVIPLEQLIGWIVALVLSGGGVVAVLALWGAARFSLVALALLVPSWAASSGALAWHLHRWPAVAYRFTSYRVDEEGIEIRRGVYWRVVVNVPRSRVQHTDVSQGPLERRFGLGTLVIYTAGTDHSRVELGGLEHGTALRIREHLLDTSAKDAV
jgi:hypothetical protein